MKRQLWLWCLMISTTLTSCTLDNKIIGGEGAALKQFPFVVYLENLMDNGNMMICSGSIVSMNWVLSAAHCTELSVVCTLKAGVVNMNDTGPNAQIRNATRIINHPQYEGVNFDISLIQVEEPFVWTEFVKPINLENRVLNDAPGECVAVGFGITSETVPTSYGDLQYLNLSSEVKPCSREAKCRGFKNHHLCSVFLQFTYNIFSGDSGGPLVCNNKQVGVAAAAGRILFFIVVNLHTSVPHFYQWIKRNTDVR